MVERRGMFVTMLCLRETDANLERAIAQWSEERTAPKDEKHATQTAANEQDTKLNGETHGEASANEARPARPSFFQSIKQRLRNRR